MLIISRFPNMTIQSPYFYFQYSYLSLVLMRYRINGKRVLPYEIYIQSIAAPYFHNAWQCYLIKIRGGACPSYRPCFNVSVVFFLNFLKFTLGLIIISHNLLHFWVRLLKGLIAYPVDRATISICILIKCLKRRRILLIYL